MSIGNHSGIAPLGIGEACERAYDSGVEQVHLADEELIEGLGFELLALIDADGDARSNNGFIVSKAIKTAPILGLMAGQYGQELVERLAADINSVYAADGRTLWTPRNFSVNQYKTGDSIHPHDDCQMQGLLRRAEVKHGLTEEGEEFQGASEKVYLDYVSRGRNPYAHDYILQVLGSKTLKHWPGDKLYRKPMSQAALDEAVEIDTVPGDLTIVRREILGDDKLPVTHSVPAVSEGGLSLVVF